VSKRRAVDATMQDLNRIVVVDAIRTAIQRLRDDDQNGYAHVHNGKWREGASLRFNAEQMNALCELAGIVPDGIVPNGACNGCIHADYTGGEGGWRAPCSSCSGPKMTNFVPLSSLTKSHRTIKTDAERMMLVNYRDKRWWATGIVTISFDQSQQSPALEHKWSKQHEKARRVKESLQRRGMIGECMGHATLLMPGKIALDAWSKGGRRRKVA